MLGRAGVGAAESPVTLPATVPVAKVGQGLGSIARFGPVGTILVGVFGLEAVLCLPKSLATSLMASAAFLPETVKGGGAPVRGLSDIPPERPPPRPPRIMLASAVPSQGLPTAVPPLASDVLRLQSLSPICLRRS